jgi:CRISPR-associated protein Csm4
MADFVIKVDFQSSFITPMHADTLWGHLCWALRYLYGEKEILDFLAAYSEGESPVILSNAFPEGFLPHPVLPPLSQQDRMDLLRRYWDKRTVSVGAAAIKALAELPYVPATLLAEDGGKPICELRLIDKLLSDPYICIATADRMEVPCQFKYEAGGKSICCRLDQDYPFRCPVRPSQADQRIGSVRAIVFHTAVSRMTGGALTGRLFTTAEHLHCRRVYEVHCKINPPFSREKLDTCLDYINHTGFGKRKSTGKGRIRCELKEAIPSKPNPNINAFMTLSNYTPEAGDPVDGCYRLLTKYVKLGGHYASSPILGGKEILPFKYPLVMFAQGSLFCIQGDLKEHYGRIVRGIHPQMTQISHYGLGYPYPLWIEI